MNRPGIYLQTNPLRVVAVAASPTGQLAALEYPLTVAQAEALASGLAGCANQEREYIAQFDAAFLAGAGVSQEVHN